MTEKLKKKSPSGYIAVCKCGKNIGAVDARRISNKDLGKLLGEWLFGGCSVHPRFESSFSVKIEGCACE